MKHDQASANCRVPSAECRMEVNARERERPHSRPTHSVSHSPGENGQKDGATDSAMSRGGDEGGLDVRRCGGNGWKKRATREPKTATSKMLRNVAPEDCRVTSGVPDGDSL